MATVVKSFAIQGIDGYPVDIETKMLDGQPMISIIGLGDQAVKEAAERIQAAIDESGYVFPKKRVIISLAPSDKKKSGSHFDLAMAIGVLQQNGDIGAKNIEDYGFIGELSLNGQLRAFKRSNACTGCGNFGIFLSEGCNRIFGRKNIKKNRMLKRQYRFGNSRIYIGFFRSKGTGRSY